MATGIPKDLPAKEQVDSLKNRISELEDRNKKLSDQNDALVKEQQDATVNGEENGIVTGEESEVLGLRKKIKDLEDIITILKAEKENAKSAGDKVQEETTDDEEKKKMQDTVEKLHRKIGEMQKEHEAEVAKLKQELIDV